MVVFGQTWLFSGKVVAIRAKVVLFGQKMFWAKVFWARLLYSGNSGSNWAKVAVFGQKWLYSD